MQIGPMPVRHDWTRDQIKGIYLLPLPELIFQAQVAHREFHKPEEIQLCRLLSIKTGACPEDCAYCPQSAHYDTGLSRQELMDPADVLVAATAREGRWRYAFLHGGRMARSARRQGF